MTIINLTTQYRGFDIRDFCGFFFIYRAGNRQCLWIARSLSQAKAWCRTQ